MVASFLKSFFSELDQAAPDARELGPFFDLVLSLKQNLPISINLLRELAGITNAKEGISFSKGGILFSRIDRRYYRLCRLQEELSRLDLKKAAPGVSPEDYVFSQIDFARYREVAEKDFTTVFSDGLGDFDESFFKKNFFLGRDEVRTTIEESYEKTEGLRKIKRENPLILSIMRALESSLEDSPLFTPKEINEELKELLDFVNFHKLMPDSMNLPYTKLLFPLLVLSLDNVLVSHADGMTTKLSFSAQGDLMGTFQPDGKAWTRVLIPSEHKIKKLTY